MQDICCKLSRTAAVVVLLMVACVGSAWASGVPWQVGDIVVCYGGGKCNVIRLHGNTVQLLDTISSGLLGNNGGVGLNNTLHVLATDDGGGGSSKVVVYSIASINPFDPTKNPLTHTVISTFNAAGNPGDSAAAVAVSSAGHIFVGNSNATGASIVELDAHGTPVTGSTFTFPGAGSCPATTAISSLDLSADGSAIYVTVADGVIRKVSLALVTNVYTLAGASCAQFANFGSLVHLYGLKDIPAGALSGTCGSGSCPAGESVLVVANGFTDPDANEPSESGPDADAVNVCTNTTGAALVSCGLLLDTNSNPGLNAPLWQAGTSYPLLTGSGAPYTILDPQLHLQTVQIAGTSGSEEPKFSETGAMVIDNAVIWTNQGPQPWQPNYAYSTVAPALPTPGTYIVDSHSNLQTVTQTGTSGPLPGPNWSTSPAVKTIDGLQWTDQGTSVWSSQFFGKDYLIADRATGHAQKAFQPGTSGANPPSFKIDGTMVQDNAVIWVESHPMWQAGTNYANGALIIDGHGHVQSVQQAGKSGAVSPPSFTANFPLPGETLDNAVTWNDLGPAVWHPSFNYGSNAIIVDGNGNVQQVTTPGTSGPGPQPPTFSSPTTDGLQWQTSNSQCTQSCSPWAPSTPYGPGAFIKDDNGIQWNVLTPGTSGMTSPAFDASDGVTNTLSDNAVVWTSQGALSGNSTFTWQPNNAYNQNAPIVDAGPVIPGTQTAVTASESGNTVTLTAGSNFPAAFTPANMIVVSGCTPSGYNGTFPIASVPSATTLTYLDSATLSNPGTGCTVQAANANVGLVAIGGASGTAQPTFNDGGTTPDGTGDTAMTWTNLGFAVWRPSFSYGLNAIIVDPAGRVQQVTTAGITGANQPPFENGATTPDNTVTWTDRGALTGNPTFTWHANTPYSLNAMIVDSANQIELVTNTGTSGGSVTFADGANTFDGLVWADQGAPAWVPNNPYPTVGAYVIDSNGNLETVSVAGTSGPASPNSSQAMPFPWPGWVAAMTVDGLIWSDQGTWLPGNHYFTPGQAVGDAQGHVHTVFTAGTSGAAQANVTPQQPVGGWADNSSLQNDNAVVWTESHPTWQANGPNHTYTVGSPDTLILDTNNPVSVQLVTNNDPQSVGISAVSGPSQPSVAGHNAWNAVPGGKTIDGLQWSNQASPATSVIARYPAPTGVFNLQSLALDPLVSNCTGVSNAGNGCQSTNAGPRMVTDSNPAVSPSFWMGDNGGSGTIYRQNFAGGTPTAIAGVCSSCRIQSVVVYGGESANQPGLASLVINGSLTSSTNTAKANFLGNSILSTLSNNNGSALTGSTAISLYGSAVDPTSCFNDPSAGSIQCKPFSANQALVLKIDIPLNGTLAVPATQTLNTAITPPAGFFDNGTDVFVDEQFDDTTFVGGDPGTRTVSVHSLHEITVSQGGASCTYSSPLQNGCYKTNRGTLNFIFTCTGLSQTQFQNLKPVLSLVKKNSGQAPLFIPLQGTNGKAPYRFNATQNFWTFQWNLNGATAGTYRGTTFDNSGTVQSFPVTFNLKTSCP